MKFPRIFITVLLPVALAVATPALAQEHAAPAPPHGDAPMVEAAQPTHSDAPMVEGAQPSHGPDQEHAAAAEDHGNPVIEVGAKLLNFGLLVGLLVYFLRSPIAGYLASRSSQIRQDLVTASELRAAAAAQLADIEKKMQALPTELAALRRQGAEDIQAEQARIAQAASAERERLLEHTRREIEMRLRIARRELTEHAARLAVQVAETRIRGTITSDDQIRLVDRYASQLQEAR